VPRLYARAMRRAAEICGEEALARELGVTPTQLDVWLKGLAEPPADVFLKVADILGDFSLQELRDQHRSAHPAS
jgi:DNA-binding transcriptional regulator YdaS (Cro superfamily)